MGRAYEVRKASIQKTGAQKAKLYSTFAKEIYLAAKSGSLDILSNVNLKRVVDKAKKAQIPGDIIKRAIDKAKGNSGNDYQTIIYEGFGPGQSTLMIKALTDNVNRTIGFVRGAFNKVNKSLGVSNSVSYNYDHYAIISFKSDAEEETLEALLMAGIEIVDIENESGYLTVTALPSDIHAVKDVLEKSFGEIDLEIDEIGWYPKEIVELSEEEKVQFDKLYHMLDEIEDITDIYHNVKI